MRILLAVLLVAFSALIGAPVRAADLPDYPDFEVPDVDYGVAGSFYLRGSAAANMMWAHDFDATCGCATGPFDFTTAGFGYSVGAGFGYEFGDGLRTDVTLDYLANDGLDGQIDAGPGHVKVGLRSTVALANAYYDFGFGDDGAASGGFGAYVGGGLGMAYYHVSDLSPSPVAGGTGITGAGAIMAGVTYDTGSIVADLGYRGIYMPQLSNGNVADPLFVNHAMVHEVRGTLRYRLQ